MTLFAIVSFFLRYLLRAVPNFSFTYLQAQTLLDYDMRLQAWAGLGPSLTNWLYEPGRVLSRLSQIFSNIPIYFLAGTVLQITSSGVLGKPISHLH